MKKNYLKQLIFIGLSMFFCANAQGQNAELRSLVEPDNAAIIYMSDNGIWACGSAFNNNDGAGFQSNASKWNLTTGERTYLVAEDELDLAQSDAFCISDDGLLVGGQYLREPAYHLIGEWLVLPMPKGYTMGEVRDFAITETDTVFIGRIFDGDGFQKIQSAKWVNGEFEKIANFLPPYHHFFRHFFYFAPICKKNCQKIGRMTLFNIANQKKQRIFNPLKY